MSNSLTPTEYWTRHNVTLHKRFTSPQESLDYLAWRNDQYPGHIENMPVSGLDGKVVLDYGCGPGNDLVGFGIFSKPAHLIGMEVSPTSLEQARERLKLHDVAAELHLLDGTYGLPFEDQSIDYIHACGVLHHMEDPLPVLKEFRRVLKPDGELRMMMYNDKSLWMHLYAAYHRRILYHNDPNMPLDEVFRKSTDGDECPVSRAYTTDQWADICASAGLNCRLNGTSISLYEMSLAHTRYSAIPHPDMPAQSRRFLLSLEVDRKGYLIDPSTGFYAGIGAYYTATPTLPL